jgi:tetratricopeptide (TPR) repeat protein
MADQSGLQLPPPADWPAFERITRRVFARLLDDPLTQLNGRSGQDQHGIDILARRIDGRYVGIQCKLKDQLANDRDLKLSQFRSEVLAARDQFKPSVGTFILATTAANDAELQEYARLLTEEFHQDGIDVQFYGWHQLQSLIGENVELREQYLGIEGVTDLSAKLDRHQSATDEKLSAILKLLPLTQDATNPHIKRSLDRTKGKMERGRVREALGDLLALKEDEWAEASTENQFILLTQIGSAYWQLNDRDTAVPYFIEASRLMPEHEKGLANLAASLAVTGDPKGARKASLKLLAINPATEMGLLALIQAQEALEPLSDPFDAVPSDRRSCEEAYLGAIQVLRNRNDERWTSLADEGLATHPESELLEKMQADSVLYRIAITDGVHAGARAQSCPTWPEIEKAADTLMRLWKAHIALDPTETDLELAQNLAQLLRALQRIDEGLEVLEKAGLDKMPNGRMTHIHAILLVLAGRGPEGRAKIAERLDVIPNRLLACHLSKDQSEVRVLLDEGDWSTATRDELLWRALLHIEALRELEPDVDLTPDLETLMEEYPERLLPLVALGRQSASPAQIDAVAERIVAAVKPDIPFRDLLLACEWLHQARKSQHLVELLGPRLSPEIDTPALHWLVEALTELGDRAGLDKLLTSVPEPLASTPRFVEYKAMAAFNSGDVAKARAAVEKRLESDPENLTVRLMWVQVLLRQSEEDFIAKWLDTPVETLAGPVGKRAELGHLLSAFGHHERAINLGYRVARENPDHKYAQERFLASCLMYPVAPATPVVASDCVFTLVDGNGNRRDYRLETEDLPRETIDLSKDAPIARAAMGNAVGDSIRLPAQMRGAPDQIFTIEAVRHKHAHYFQLLADTMPTHFDGPVMLHKFSIDPETGAGIDVLHDTLRISSEEHRETIEQYRVGALPFRMLALTVGKDVIECYDGLGNYPAVRFKAEQGRVNAEAAAGIASNQKRGCLVDAITMEIIRRNELLDVVRAVAGPVFITQDTLDLFITRCERNRQLGALQDAGTFSHHNGETVHYPDVPVLREAAAEERAKARDWVIANCKVVPSVGPTGLARKLNNKLPEELQALLVDDILAAAQADVALLSDDLGYRMVARASGVNITFGVTAVLRFALEKEAIGHAEYVAKLSKLAAAQHTFLPISSNDLRQALALDNGELGRVIRPLLALLGGPGCDLPSHLSVAVTFLDAVWSLPGFEQIRLPLLLHVADRLLGAGTPARTELRAAIFRDPDMGVEQLYHHVAAVIEKAEQPPVESK